MLISYEALKHHIKGFLSGRLLISWGLYPGGLLICWALIPRGVAYIWGAYIPEACLYLGDSYPWRLLISGALKTGCISWFTARWAYNLGVGVGLISGSLR